MKTFVVTLIALSLAASAVLAHPAVMSPSLSFLPAEGQVIDLLAQDPGVRQAGAMLNSAQAQARALEAGPHEFTLYGNYLSRATNVDGHLNEWTMGINRAIRLPGKADADGKIGAFGVAAAQNGFGDARHQAATLLKTLWLGWVVAENDARLASGDVAGYERQFAATERSRQLGQSAMLEVEQVQAALAQARALAAQAQEARLEARMTLQRVFPGLAIPAAPPAMPEPAAPPGTWPEWRAAVMEDNHEIKMARSEADRREWQARRASMDRFADPTLDLRTFQERSGHETGFGVGFSIPIGGALRQATADQASAEAAAASVAAHRVLRDVEIVADRDVIQAQQGLEAWRASQAAATSSAAMLTRMQRAHDLGDQGLTELLIARRQDADVRRAEARARAAAHSAILQLMIDSHRIWGLGDEE
jgi:outer membrane protein TolC